MLAAALGSLGATCSTVGPTEPGVGPAPLSESRPTALAVSAIAAIGQGAGMQGLNRTTQSSVAVGGALARRLSISDGFSLDMSASAAAYRSTLEGGPVPVGGVGGRLWLGPDGPLPLGVELAVVERMNRVLEARFSPTLEVRLLAAYRFPGRGCLWIAARPGLYGWALTIDPRFASLELPIGAAFDLGALRIGGELGVDWFPAGGVWGARANASAAATF
ncbi:MAG: hypothetical protein A2138_09760 [Deltaproteobacteria bacterium RBG_16_71_12]|nr:MAG: hypothetical protein A2138_09760 [Deltaproteobacteria bacterium RBG_16_71_12]